MEKIKSGDYQADDYQINKSFKEKRLVD